MHAMQPRPDLQGAEEVSMRSTGTPVTMKRVPHRLAMVER
jgi:hypothetical protein